MAEPQYDDFGNIISLDSDLDKPSTYNIYENRAFSSRGSNFTSVFFRSTSKCHIDTCIAYSYFIFHI